MSDLLQSLEDTRKRLNGGIAIGARPLSATGMAQLVEEMIIAEKRRRRDMSELQQRLEAAERTAKSVGDSKLLDIAAQVMTAHSTTYNAEESARYGLQYARELLRQFNGPTIEPWEQQNDWMKGP